ncbi:hypothetical protein [Microvirus mar35]|uniref:Uncharacterized protein n=1 Tax=Microvirus mar35 TaxID=2851169 RepID=A0A8F5RC15_9VIRU|nr:hypothetical protein [Microvirus mar35]
MKLLRLKVFLHVFLLAVNALAISKILRLVTPPWATVFKTPISTEFRLITLLLLVLMIPIALLTLCRIYVFLVLTTKSAIFLSPRLLGFVRLVIQMFLNLPPHPNPLSHPKSLMVNRSCLLDAWNESSGHLFLTIYARRVPTCRVVRTFNYKSLIII